MSREDEIQKQAAIIKKRFRELAGIPDLSDPEDAKKIASEIKQKIEKEKNNAEEFLKEISNEEPHLIVEGYFNFKKNLSDYGKLNYYLANNKNDKILFSESAGLNVSTQLNKSLKNLKYVITKLASVYSYQVIREKGILQASSEDFNSYYDKDKGLSDEEREKKELLSTNEARQRTTSYEKEEEKPESILLIVQLIDKYIAGDNENEIARAFEAAKRRDKIEAVTFASSPSIKKITRQIEKENDLARKIGREDLFKPSKDIPSYAWLRFMRGNILQKDNYYRRKHLHITSCLGESFTKDSLWEQEGMNHIFVEIILSKWRELHSDDTSLTLNNYYRSLFASAVFHRKNGYDLIDNLRKDLFGRWQIRPKQVKRSTMWSLLQDCLDRNKDQHDIKTFPEKIDKSQKQKILNKFGHRDWLVYLFRKNKNYGLRPTVEEIQRQKFKISKKTIDPIVSRIDDWLENK